MKIQTFNSMLATVKSGNADHHEITDRACENPTEENLTLLLTFCATHGGNCWATDHDLIKSIYGTVAPVGFTFGIGRPWWSNVDLLTVRFSS
ncbi:MAG TPA: hypothetical protein EYN66_06015 [Myxococcales bacterium]|nr:hypothetical protein [Myxococcales bacterium]